MKIEVQKFDPAVDVKPYYVSGEVPCTDKMTLLEAMVYFNENCEYIAFDYSCHGRHCGRCTVMLDGIPTLACDTPITDADHTIEPLLGFTVIHDLIVDKTDYHDRLSKEYMRVRLEPIKEEDVELFDGSVAEQIRTINSCMRCGICDAGCPIHNSMPSEFAGPSTMIALAFRHLDSYDQADRVLEAVSKGLYHCIQCGQCDALCHRYDIDHLGTWKMLREEAEKRGLKPSYAE